MTDKNDKVTIEEIDSTINFIHMYLHPCGPTYEQQMKLKHRELSIKALEYYKSKVDDENDSRGIQAENDTVFS